MVGSARFALLVSVEDLHSYGPSYASTGLLFSSGWAALLGRGLLYEVSPSHSDTPHSVGLLWASDWPIVETCT